MNLGNALKREGGTAETGRPVRFQIRHKVKDAVERRWVNARLFVVGESQRAAANEAAAKHCAQNLPGLPDLEDEKVYRFLQQALRDADAPAAQFILNDELDLFRDGVTADQCRWLMRQYTEHASGEYPELISVEDAKKLEQQAEDFTKGGQPS